MAFQFASGAVVAEPLKVSSKRAVPYRKSQLPGACAA